MNSIVDTENLASTDANLSYVLLRIVLGVNMLMHGVSRIAGGVGKFAGALEKQFASTFLPAWSVHIFGLTLPFVEGSLGLLLLIGLATRFALVAGQVLMAVLMFGVCLTQQWDTAGVQLIYAIVFAGLLFFRRHDRFAVDNFI